MPTTTYTPIATITVGSATNTVSFTGISQSFNDLQLAMAYSVGSTAEIAMRFNNDSSAIYAWQNWNTSAYLDTQIRLLNATGFFVGLTAIFTIPQYTLTDRFKTIYGRGGVGGQSTSSNMNSYGAGYRTTTAITSIQLLHSGNFQAGSVFTLYGTVR
jgi:hypothetical protein